MTMYNNVRVCHNQTIGDATLLGNNFINDIWMDKKMIFFRINIFRLRPKFLVGAIILGVIFSISSAKVINAESGVTFHLIKEARVLAERQKKLFSARIETDWSEIHSFQHPDFRKKVSVDEVRYFEGWVTHDYRERAKQKPHVSGATVPTLDFIKKHPHKFDVLGFPVARRYLFSGDPFLKVKTYTLEKISISNNGKYAKVRTLVKGKQKLNPAVVRGKFEFDAQYPLTDYWEKVGENWVITLLSAPISNSGMGVLKYYLPNNNSAWKKMDFVEVNPEDLNLS